MEAAQLLDKLLYPKKEESLQSVVSLSIIEIQKELLVKAKFYSGDLLITLLSQDVSFWKNNPQLWQQLSNAIDSQQEKIKQAEASFEMKGEWYAKIERFKGYMI